MGNTGLVWATVYDHIFNLRLLHLMHNDHLNCLAFCQKFGRPGDCIHLMRTSACQVSSVQGNAYLDDKKLTAIFFLGSRQNLGDLSSTENECPICPSTIKGCVRRKPSICICSCAHPFAKKLGTSHPERRRVPSVPGNALLREKEYYFCVCGCVELLANKKNG